MNNNNNNDMNFYNKTVLVKNLQELKQVLNEEKIKKSWLPSSICSEKIAIRHNIINRNMNIIKIWRTNTIFDYQYDEFSCSNFIGCLDYINKWDCIKIDYLNVNYTIFTYLNRNSNILNEEEVKEVIHMLIDLMKKIAKTGKKNKIIVDVHQNLKIYKRYYEREGFIVTNYKCYDNPYWVEAELNI